MLIVQVAGKWLPDLLAAFGLVGRGKHAEFSLEIAGEVFGIIESGLVGDLRDGKPADLEQLGGPFKTDRPNKFDRGLAGQGQQSFVKTYTAKEKLAAHFLDGKIRIGDIFLDQDKGLLH